jgi:P-type conjugative transfer protein TrbJ
MKKIGSILTIALLSCALCIPAQAQFAVIDGANLIQTTLTAARSLEQIANQVRSLQNEALMLINEGKNLTSLNYNGVNRLLATLGTTNQLLAQAQGLSLLLQRTQTQFAQQYPRLYPAGVNNAQMAQDAYARWQNSLEALRTSVNVQSQSNQNFASDTTSLTDLVNQSQNAAGALGALQATNQLLALHARQLIGQQQLALAQDRATATEQARAVAAQARASQVRLLFTAGGVAYVPQPVGGFGP